MQVYSVYIPYKSSRYLKTCLNRFMVSGIDGCTGFFSINSVCRTSINLKLFIFLLALPLFICHASIVRAADESSKISSREIIEGQAELKAGQKSLNIRIDDLNISINKRIDDHKAELKDDINDIKTFLYWGFGVLFSIIFILITLIIWDRRTAIKPAVDKAVEVEEREMRIEKALKEYARIEPRFADVLRSFNLL